MTLRPRLARLERLAAALRERPLRCRTCGEPNPSVPATAVLVPEGFDESGPDPCTRCGQRPGGLAEKRPDGAGIDGVGEAFRKHAAHELQQSLEHRRAEVV